eukprot:scaffold14532_cov133-Skeletonema_menzelii.AAC.1
MSVCDLTEDGKSVGRGKEGIMKVKGRKTEGRSGYRCPDMDGTLAMATDRLDRGSGRREDLLFGERVKRGACT